MKSALGAILLSTTLMMPGTVSAGFLDGLAGDVLNTAVNAAVKKAAKPDDAGEITDTPTGRDPFLPHKYLKAVGGPKAKPIGAPVVITNNDGISNETIYQTEAFAAAKPASSTAKAEGLAALIKKIKALGQKERKSDYTYVNLVRHDGEGGADWIMETEPVETDALIAVLTEPSSEWENLDLVIVGRDHKLGDTPITGFKGHFRVVWEPKDMSDGGLSYVLTPAELHKLIRQATGANPSYNRPKLAKKPFETGSERDAEARSYSK